MKKSLVIATVLCLVLSMTAFGQGVKGKSLVSGFAGYSLGFGDAFGEESGTFDGLTLDISFKPTLNFGGMYHYGMSEKLMIGGEISLQSYKAEVTATYEGITESASESETETNILFNALYAMNYVEGEQAMYLTFGGGSYGFGESELGLFGGFVYQKKMSSSMDFFIMPRFHYILAEYVKPTMITLSVGISLPLGNK